MDTIGSGVWTQVGCGCFSLLTMLPLALAWLLGRAAHRADAMREAAYDEQRWLTGNDDPAASDVTWEVATDPRTGKPVVLPPESASANPSTSTNTNAGAGLDAAGYPDVTPGTLVEIGGYVFTMREVEALERVRERSVRMSG